MSSNSNQLSLSQAQIDHLIDLVNRIKGGQEWNAKEWDFTYNITRYNSRTINEESEILANYIIYLCEKFAKTSSDQSRFKGMIQIEIDVWMNRISKWSGGPGFGGITHSVEGGPQGWTMLPYNAKTKDPSTFESFLCLKVERDYMTGGEWMLVLGEELFDELTAYGYLRF